MNRFEAPMMEIQRLDPEDVFTNSCLTEALGCDSCYCSGVICSSGYNSQCTGCNQNTSWGCDD